MPDQPASPIPFSSSAPSAALRGEPAPPDLHTQLTQATQDLANLKRDRQIARALYASNVIDEDIATVLIEHDLARTPTADIPMLVNDLKKRKPRLFRDPDAAPKPPTPSPTLAPPLTEAPKHADLIDAARANHRPSLIAYMRTRRG